jgi:hypothetical protein
VRGDRAGHQLFVVHTFVAMKMEALVTRYVKQSTLTAGAVILAVLFSLAGAKMLAVGVDRGVATFTIELGGTPISSASAYSLESVERNNKVLYSLKITRHLTHDTSLVSAFQSGIVFNPAVVRVYDGSLNLVNTYSLGNASISSVRHFGLSSDTFVTEEIAVLATSLSVTAP